MNETPVIKNPVKAIRAKCLDCCCGHPSEVAICTATKCPLFPFRYGKNPYRTKRELTEEQKEAQAAILAKARLSNRQEKTENVSQEGKDTSNG